MVRKFDALNYALLFILTAIFILPLLYVLFLSLSDSFLIANGTFQFLPIGINFKAYSVIFQYDAVWTGYRNSILYAASGTLLTLVLCSLPGYVLSVHEFRHKRLFTVFFSITMFFSGGIIPTFLVISNLGLLDSIWSIIIIPALSAWNIILFRTNFKQIPCSLTESAKMDGAGHFWIFARIVAPLSKPVFAVLSIFSIVGFWNSYFTALLYLSSPEKQPLMILLRKLVIVGNVRGETESIIVQFGQTISGLGMERAMKAAVIICSILPIVMVYPFMQKYLAKGIMIGAIRG